MADAAFLFIGKMYHQRKQVEDVSDVSHRLSYPLTWTTVDIDMVSDPKTRPSWSPLWSFDSRLPALAWWRRGDYFDLGDPSVPLGDCVRTIVRDAEWNHARVVPARI